MCRPYCQADDIWKTNGRDIATQNQEYFACIELQQKDKLFALPESFGVSASWISDTSGAAKRTQTFPLHKL